MRRLVAASILILLAAAPAFAQRDCGDGLPCGRLPWDLPVLPQLPSPTPMPTFALTVQPTPGAGTPTVAPSPTLALVNTIDTSAISNQVGTMSAVMASTPYIIQDFNGTPVDTSESLTELEDNASFFFGYARSISSAYVGKLSPLMTFMLLSVAVIVSIKATTYLLPFISAVVGLVRKVISLILDFLPL